MKLRHRFQLTLLKCLLAWLDKKTQNRSSQEITRFGQKLGVASTFFDLSFRLRIINSLKSSLGPQVKAKEILGDIVKNQMGRVFVDSFLSWRDLKSQPYPHEISFENLDLYKKLYPHKHGLILITGHYGLWELIPQVMSARGYPFTVVQRKHSNPGINQLLNDFRSANGCEVIDFHRKKSDSFRQCLGALKQGRALGFLVDVVPKTKTVDVPFLGKVLPAPQGPAMLSLLSGAPVMSAFCERTSSGYKIIFEEPISWPHQTPQKEDIQEMTTRILKRVETRILEHPDHWMWFLRRWAELPYTSKSS